MNPQVPTATEKTSAATTARLTLDGKDYDLPVVVGSEGERAIDIRKLRDTTGAVTLDPGYGNTGACLSGITFIDGDKGILQYRGYPIDELAEKASFLEVAYLLIYGKLPNAAEWKGFSELITRHTLLHEDMKKFFEGYPPHAHPMAILAAMVASLSTYYPDSANGTTDLNIARLVAKLPTIAAFSFKKSVGQPFVYPRNDLSYCGNFLNMMFSVPTEPYEINPVLARAMDKIMILHADHEQNASTSTVRLAGSSGANPFACISSGIACLWGPAHGGANEAALNMLEQIGTVDKIPEFIAKVKDPKSDVRLMGFGHRVYKNYDPRAKAMMKLCHQVLKETGGEDNPTLQVAMELEKIALNDDYFVSRKLYPNIDFYSGITLRAMGFPTSMFTVLFAVARTVGWIAQWTEMMEDDSQKIGRPRQVYTGAPMRDYVPCNKRG